MKELDLDKLQINICNLYIICISTVLFLFTGFEGYANITTYKLITFWAIAGLFCIAIIISIIAKHNKLDLKLLMSNISWAQRCATLYLFFTLLSWIFSSYKADSLVGMSRGEGLITISLYILSFLFISKFGSCNKKLLIVLICSFFIFEALSLVQFIGYNPLGLYPAGFNYNDANIDYYGAYIGTIGNVDIASAFIAPTTTMLCIASYRGPKKTRIASFIVAIIGIYIIFKIGVKSGILGFVLSLFVLLPFILKLKANDRKRLCIILVVILVFALLFIFFVDVNSGMLHELHQILHGNLNPNFGTGRIRIWTAVLKELPGHILFGYGPDTMLASNIEPWESHINKYNMDYFAYIDAAHNEYLNVWYHQGIFALLSFIGIIFFTLFESFKNPKQSDVEIILEGFIVCYAIQASFNISMCLSAPYFWVAMALLCSEQAPNK